MSRHFDPQNDRLNYGEALAPPPEYDVDFAVGMTYSLDLEAFLSVPVFLGCSEQTDEISQNPYLLLESIKRNSEKIALFCNGDGIKYASPKNAAFFAMIENCVYPVSLRENHYFHPKLWVIRYVKPGAPDRIRVIVLSRNLTFDQSMDIAVTLDADVTNEINNAHQGLADILLYVSKRVPRKKARDQVISLADSVMYAGRFDCGEDFDSYRFIPYGIPGHREEAEDLYAWAYDTIVVSPFLTESVVKRIADNSKYKSLITRMTSVSKKVFNAFDEVWVPKEELLNNEVLEEGSINNEARDLHAKIIYRTVSDGNYLCLGSLNATHNAFFKNVEFMIELKYKAYHGGCTTVHEDLLPEKNSVFRKLDAPCPDADIETDEDLYDFSDVVRAVESAAVIQQGDSYQLVINSGATREPVEISPFMLNPGCFKELTEETVYNGLKLQELSCLYIIRRGDQNRIIKIPTKNIPEDRNDILFNQILKDEAGFYTYLLYLLSDGHSEIVFHQEDFQRSAADGQNGYDGRPLNSLAPPLYEELLRSAASSADKIRSVSDAIKRIDLDKINVDDSMKDLIGLINKSIRKRR